jgi:hypothetical protein
LNFELRRQEKEVSHRMQSWKKNRSQETGDRKLETGKRLIDVPKLGLGNEREN